MLYSKKETPKAPESYCSVPSSPSMTDATTKKKMFARKPANAIGNLVPEKKKPTFEESLDSLTLLRPQDPKTASKPIPDYRHRDRVSEVALPVKTESSINKYREIFFSPKSEKSLLVGGGLFQRRPSRNQTDAKSREFKDISLRSTIGFANQRPTAFEASFDNEDSRRNWKLKTNSSQSYVSAARPGETRRSSEKSLPDSGLLIECSYCLNHKRKADILAEKYAKLEEQAAAKAQTARELTAKCDQLHREKAELCLKLERAIENLQAREEEFFRSREELAGRVEACKKDVVRLTESLKYSEIEKSMLLRFKADFQAASRECELLRYENEQFKKQLIAQANREHGYSFAKRTPPDAPSFAKKQPQQQPSIYYDCEDDALSLNFSEHSYDCP